MEKTIDELSTLRDFIRYAVTRFNKAEIVYINDIDNALDEAVFLITETMQLPIGELEHFMDAVLTTPERKEIIDIIDKRIRTRKPSAYLTNKMYVQDFPFFIDERVNIPRTFLGDLLLSELSNINEGSFIEDPEKITNVLDLCTGSGFLSILSTYIFKNANIDAVDISTDAIDVAKINIKEYEAEEQINLHEGDLFRPVAGQKYDLIISSPPYLSSKNLKKLPPEHAHAPRRAIESGNDGLRIVKRIINSAADYLSEDGILLCEIGEDSKQALEKEYPHLKFMWLQTEYDESIAFWLKHNELLF